MQKNTRFSEDDSLSSLNYLPPLDISLFECGNIKSSSNHKLFKCFDKGLMFSYLKIETFNVGK